MTLGVEKTRVMDLSDSEIISMIRSAGLIQYTRVTDGRTDRQTADGQTESAWLWHIRAIAYMLSRVKTVKCTGSDTWQIEMLHTRIWLVLI